MNRVQFQHSTFCGALLLAMWSLAPAATAQTRMDVGYVYIDGRNEVRRPGSLSDEGIYSDWRRVDSGLGAALSFLHEWENLYVKGSAHRLTLANRNESRTRQCSSPPVGQPPVCADSVSRFRYDERYKSYELKLGWGHPISQSVSIWGELGAVREIWSRSGGSRVSYWEGVTEPTEFSLTRASANELAWTAGAGVDFALGQASGLLFGIDYRSRGYFPSEATLAQTFHRQSSSLLQGVIGYRQIFAGPWEGFIEYRPSQKRQYWQAGIGYRF